MLYHFSVVLQHIEKHCSFKSPHSAFDWSHESPSPAGEYLDLVNREEKERSEQRMMERSRREKWDGG